MNERPFALVVQRYGEEVVGGSESLCRVIAEMIVPHRPIEVLTSCAKDYMTWKSEYRPGISTLNGVKLRRFPVDFERDHRFHETFGAILGGMPPTAYSRHKDLMRQIIAQSPTEQQLACLRLQGPYSTPMLEYLSAHHQDYELVVFFTYLYPTTFFGSQRVPAYKTILVPTAHDEALIHLPVFQEMFARFPAYVFLTPEERRFIEEAFDVEDTFKATIGMPLARAAEPNPRRFRDKYKIQGPFLLYAGRLDPAKGCDDLLHFYQAAQRHLPPATPLILIGSRVMGTPRHPQIHYLGMLPEQDKLDAMAAASIVINPSPFESFSIVTLEAMSCGTPVLVNSRSEVLKGHVQRSSGGLYYETYFEFVEAIRLMLDDHALRSRMGANGNAYVRRNYSRENVERRYMALFELVGQAT